MKIIDLTFPTPALNLACDEALLDHCEEGYEHEILRFWEPHEHFIVLGYSNKIRSEINEFSCRRARVPVLRRCSGGGTVLQGPGCLNFSLILRIDRAAGLENITRTNAYVLERHRKALSPLTGGGVRVEGTSDLALGGLKFSGNAQRRKSRWILFHGTFLTGLDLGLVEKFLAMPSRQPEYRRNRPHRDFLTNIEIPAARIKKAIAKIWGASDPFRGVPRKKIGSLARGRYSTRGWNRGR